MTVDNILAVARQNTHASASQFPDSTYGINSLNIAYQQFAAKLISSVGENFLFKTWLDDAVADQTDGEYDLPAVTSANAGMRKLARLDIKPTTEYSNYIKATPIQLENLPYDWDWYLLNQPTDKPIYFLVNKKIRIAPNFTSDTAGSAPNNQIKFSGQAHVIDLATGGAEATVLVPVPFHWILALGQEQFIYKHLGKRNEAVAAKQEFEFEMSKAIEQLSDRDESTTSARLPETMANE